MKEQERELQEEEKELQERKKRLEEKKKKILQQRLNTISGLKQQLKENEEKRDKLIQQIKDEEKNLQDLGLEISSSASSSSSSSWAGKAKVGASNGNSVSETKSQTKSQSKSQSKSQTKSHEPTEWLCYLYDSRKDIVSKFTVTKKTFQEYLEDADERTETGDRICGRMAKDNKTKCDRSRCGFLHPSRCNDEKCTQEKKGFCRYFHDNETYCHEKETVEQWFSRHTNNFKQQFSSYFNE